MYTLKFISAINESKAIFFISDDWAWSSSFIPQIRLHSPDGSFFDMTDVTGDQLLYCFMIDKKCVHAIRIKNYVPETFLQPGVQIEINTV